MADLISEAERALLVETRRDLHAHPELAWDEARTGGKVAERLEAAGYSVERVASTGVVARLEGKPNGKTVLLRADMDALPLTEENDVPYRSTQAGVMHACGHDGHTAALLTAADRMKAGALPDGNVVFCFQPAEEGQGGAERMVKEQVLDGVDAVFGLHLWNGLPVGKVGVSAGPVMAAADVFEITLEGVGGHGAMPDQTVDPIVAACHVVTALQTIVARNTAPADTCVVTVGKIVAGDNWNVIPRTARLYGTCRAYSPETHRALPGRLRKIVEGVAGGLGCKAEIEYRTICPPVVNEPGMTALVAETVRDLLGDEAVAEVRAMVAEDFSYFLQQSPGCFFFVGSRNEERDLVHPHHSTRFDFDEAALPIAVRLLEEVGRRFLGS